MCYPARMQPQRALPLTPGGTFHEARVSLAEALEWTDAGGPATVAIRDAIEFLDVLGVQAGESPANPDHLEALP